MSKHVCIVLPGPARKPGGGHKVAYQHANYLVNQGLSVTLAHLRPNRECGGWIRSVVRRFAYAMGRGWRPSWFELDPRVRVLNRSKQLDRYIPLDADTLVATSVGTARFVTSVAGDRGMRGLYLIQHVEDWSHSMEEVEATWRLPMERVVVSVWLQEELARRGLSSTLVRNGIDVDEFPPGPPIAARTPNVLALVSTQPWKRSDVVLDVFRAVHDLRPEVQLKTFGVGPPAPGTPKYVKHVSNPKSNELSSLYRTASIYLCASDFEGFGLPAAEAMSSGAGIVSTNNGGVPQTFPEVTEFPEPGDVEGLTQQVLALLSDTAELGELVRRGTEALGAITLEASGRSFHQLLVAGIPGE